MCLIRRSISPEAELFIRYITDSRPVTAPVDDNATMTAPGGGQSGAVINSEIKILTSFDLAQQVANAVGFPEKILAKVGGGKDPALFRPPPWCAAV